jgi:hypothetical protein
MNPTYLDVRCAYVIARLNVMISEQFGTVLVAANAATEAEASQLEEIELCLAEQIDNAEQLGWRDAQAGFDDQVPLLFADEQSLSAAWERGVYQFDLTIELANCKSCHAAGFDPCRYHG